MCLLCTLFPSYENMQSFIIDADLTQPCKDSIKDMVSGQNDSFSECRYVVLIARAGPGNRILSIASAFIYAILTNRVLLINEEPEMANQFCEPFPNATWIELPKDFPNCPRTFPSWIESPVSNRIMRRVTGVCLRRIRLVLQQSCCQHTFISTCVMITIITTSCFSVTKIKLFSGAYRD